MYSQPLLHQDCLYVHYDLLDHYKCPIDIYVNLKCPWHIQVLILEAIGTSPADSLEGLGGWTFALCVFDWFVSMCM